MLMPGYAYSCTSGGTCASRIHALTKCQNHMGPHGDHRPRERKKNSLVLESRNWPGLAPSGLIQCHFWAKLENLTVFLVENLIDSTFKDWALVVSAQTPATPQHQQTHARQQPPTNESRIHVHFALSTHILKFIGHLVEYRFPFRILVFRAVFFSREYFFGPMENPRGPYKFRKWKIRFSVYSVGTRPCARRHVFLHTLLKYAQTRICRTQHMRIRVNMNIPTIEKKNASAQPIATHIHTIYR